MFCLFSFSVVMSSCSSDDDGTEGSEQNNDGRKLRQLTITEVPITRATLTDNTSSLSAAWSAGDQATYFNLTSHTENDLVLDFGALSASSANATSNFTGTVRCKTGDQIALFYPATYNSESTGPVTTSGTNRGKFTISLSGQKGTLNDIAANYHYVYGVGDVTATSERVGPETASATISSMKSLLAVCKFTFKDKDTNADIPVKSLSINYNDTYYPLTGTVVPSTDAASVVATPADPSLWERPLTVTLDAETSDGVYVALFPVSAYTFQFTVTTEANVVYTGTATATLKAGKFYNVPPLKLTKKLPSNN